MAATFITYKNDKYVLETMKSGLYPENWLLRKPGAHNRSDKDSFSLEKNKISFEVEGYGSRLKIIYKGVIIGSYNNVTMQSICNAANHYYSISSSNLEKLYLEKSGIEKTEIELEVSVLSKLKDELSDEINFLKTKEEKHKEIKILYENI